jgi:hypothetical protein
MHSEAEADTADGVGHNSRIGVGVGAGADAEAGARKTYTVHDTVVVVVDGSGDVQDALTGVVGVPSSVAGVDVDAEADELCGCGGLVGEHGVEGVELVARMRGVAAAEAKQDNQGLRAAEAEGHWPWSVSRTSWTSPRAGQLQDPIPQYSEQG